MTDYEVTHLAKFNPDKKHQTMTTEETDIFFDALIKFFDAWDYKNNKDGKEVQEFLRSTQQRIKELKEQLQEIDNVMEVILDCPIIDVNSKTSDLVRFKLALEKYQSLKKR